jgi:hypothetical protein
MRWLICFLRGNLDGVRRGAKNNFGFGWGKMWVIYWILLAISKSVLKWMWISVKGGNMGMVMGVGRREREREREREISLR